MSMKRPRRNWVRCIFHSPVAAAAVDKDKATREEEEVKLSFTGPGSMPKQQLVGSHISHSQVDFAFAFVC
jgi:hypothetical protein